MKEEKTYELNEIIEGSIPEDLNGVFMKNGPNPNILPKTGGYHWFDGQGMIHSFRIK